MFGTIYTSYSGILASSTGINIASNNLANINTAGFKRSEGNFAQLMSSMVDGRSGNGNPIQHGLGVLTNQITQSFTQGSIQNTGLRTNLALEGSGFFTASRGGDIVYTRAGNFSFNPSGALAAPDGSIIQGYIETDANGAIDTNGAVGDIILDLDAVSPPKQTSLVRLITNLSATAVEGDNYTTTVDIWDNQGNNHPVTVNFTKSANTGEWTYEFTGDNMTIGNANGQVTFDAQGQLATVDGLPISDPAVAARSLNFSNLPNGADDFSINFDLIDDSDPNNIKGLLTNYSSFSSTGTLYQDGFGSGELQSIDFLDDGTMVGSYTNGAVAELARVFIANFPNTQGLKQLNNGFYGQTATSGEPFAPVDGSTQVRPGSLETSNVDIADELTSLIIHQRGFQGNSKAVTTSDQILQEILGLKR